MTLRLPGHWLWDFWFAQDGADVHVFYLQAPRALGDPALRHRNATIGHAVSRDLRSWRVLPDALGPGEPGEFDDLATWTGSIVRHGGRWELFYTGIARAEDGAVQRIGRAESADLVRWERRGVVLEADPRWYERETWRDPWVEPADDGFEMLVTARARHGPPDGRGVVALARSDDLGAWEAGPPLSEPGEFLHLEVPQRLHAGGAWRILFCVTRHEHAAARLARPGVEPQWGTHYLTSASRSGPYRLDRDDFLAGDPHGRRYAGRVLDHAGGLHFFAWDLHDAEGRFVGALSDPMPLRVGPGGSLSVDVPQ